MKTTYKHAAIEAALKAGSTIKRSVGRIASISYKGIDNIVTDVDKKSEAIIITHIRRSFPDHAILSEESAPRGGISQYKWIIDPLDGTTNFAHAFPFFSVSIALEKTGEIIMGVVFDPMRDELFYAEKDAGAFLNRRRIFVSKTRKLSQGFLSTGFSYGNKEKGKNVRHFRNLLMKSLAIRRPGSAALDLCYVACGRFDGFWEMNLFPWDSAAGVVIVREAGGLVTRFDGSRFTPYDKDILASNSHIHSQISRVLSRSF